jgi:hypothetical protein
MQRRSLVWTVALSAVCIGTARAEFVDGNRLKGWLDADARVEAKQQAPSQQDIFDAGRAQGFVVAVWDVGIDAHFCVTSPNPVTLEQVMAVARKYLEANPARWSSTAHSLVQESFRRSFPCKR